MPSKRSFFNRTLFRKNLTRFWPLWGGLSLLGSLVPLYMLLALLSSVDPHVSANDFGYALYTTAVHMGPAASFLYAAVCAMLVWSYLYSPRSVGLMHTLPVDRTCLFVTTALSGLTMMIIPYAVVGAFTCLIALAWGFMDLLAVANTILAILLMTVTFFGLATFCAMLTGHVFALPVLYVLLNFLAPLLEALISSLSSEFLIGLGGMETGWTTVLAPVVRLYQVLSVTNLPSYTGDSEECMLVGFGALALYGLAGLALLGLAWLLYRRRASESAGDVAAFPWLRPIFRYGLALLGALTLGRIFYEMLWDTFFHQSRYANPIAMAVCMALAGVLGYYIASMLLEKSLRVFRGSWRGIVIVCAGAAVICLTLSVDAFGAERRVPENVEKVSMHVSSMTLSYDASEDPEMVERILDLHRTIVAERDYIREQSDDWRDWEQEGRARAWLQLSYRLKGGSTLERGYSLWITGERMADPETYDGKLAALLSDPQVAVDQIAMPENGRLLNVEVYYNDYGSGDQGVMTPEEYAQLYDALILDARAGAMEKNLLDDYERPTQPADVSISISLEYRVPDATGGSSYQYRYIDLTPKMENTIEALLKLGCISQARMDLWREEYDAVLGGGEEIVR